MRKLLLISAAVLSMTVAGCNSGGTVLTDEQIAQIQAATVAACGFLPTAITIANTIPAAQPYTPVATVIASAICSTVTKQTGIRSASVKEWKVDVVIDGKAYPITVNGRFVTKLNAPN